MLEAVEILGVVAAGLLAGVASGLFGVGGGVLMVPAALYLVPGTDFHTAKAVSLVVIVGSAAVGIWTHHRHRSVDFRKGALLALGGLAGAAISVMVAERIAGVFLTAIFAVVLAITGARLVGGRDPAPRERSRRAQAGYLAALGFASGLLSGALGVGGGIIMVPGMLLAGINMHTAVGTSLVAVLGNAVGATASHAALGYGPALVSLGMPLAIGAIPGAYMGSKLAHRIHTDRLKSLFGVGLIVVGVLMATDVL